MIRIKHFIFLIAAALLLFASALSRTAEAASVAVSPDAVTLEAGGSPAQITIFNIEARDIRFFIRENSGTLLFSQENVLIPAKGKASVNVSARESCARSNTEIEISPESQGEIIPSLFVAARIVPAMNCQSEKSANPAIGLMLSAAISCLGLIPYIRRRRINP